MMRFSSGAKVQRGYYFSLRNWEIIHIDAAGEALPGDGDAFLRLWLPLLPVVALTMGVLMVMFLPFIGLALSIGVAVRKAVRGLRVVVAELAERIESPSRRGPAVSSQRQPVPVPSAASDGDNPGLVEAAAEQRGAAAGEACTKGRS